MKQPLAFRMRPTHLDEVAGQKHLVNQDGILRKCVETNTLFSMILYGPPGTGKTTLATILCNELNLPYRKFNAVTGSKKDLDKIFEESRFYNGLVVIIDEIHRLNRDKQDTLLPYMEDGSIYIIGATTSNPYFAINPAIRSRAHLLEIKELSKEDVIEVLDRALNSEQGLEGKFTMDEEAKELIAQRANGDLRYGLNLLELCSLACTDNHISKEVVLAYASKASMSISADADGHYDAVSALQKSIRGSDVDAALYYLARLIMAQDMDSIERRLLVIAYEDIGLGNPAAVSRTVQAIDAAKRVGFPEARIILAEAVIDLALSPKSRSAEDSIDAAIALVEKKDYNVPDYLKFAPAALSEEDKYDYGTPAMWPHIQYLPDAIKNEQFYQFKNSGSYEKALYQNYQELKKIKRSNNMRALRKQFKEK